MGGEKRQTNNYFDGLPLAAPQIMIFLILMAAYFFQQFSNWSFSFLVMGILKSSDLVGQAGNAAMARITWWYFLGMTIGGIGGGIVSDLAGRRKAMLGGLLILSLSTAVAGATSNLEVFIAARAMTGFGVFALMIASHAYIAEMTPPASRGKWQCWIAAAGFSAAPASALLSRLTLKFSPDAWRYVLSFGGLGIVAFFLGLTYLKESPRWLVAKGRRGEAEDVVEELTGYRIALPPEDGAESPRTKTAPVFLGMFSRPYRKRTLTLLSLFVLYTPASFINAFWLPQLLANHLTPAETANLMQYISCGVPLGCLLGAAVTERGGRKIPLALLILLAGTASFIIFLAPSYYMFLFIGFFTQVFNMASSFILFSYAAEQFPTRFRNAAAGILNGLGRFAVSGFQPLIVVILAGRGIGGVFELVALLLFLSLPVLLIWGKKTAGLPLEKISIGDPG